MVTINTYSKKQRKTRGGVNDVYQYNNIPHALRVQIIRIITDSISSLSSNERYISYRNEADKVYAYIHEMLSKEYGVSSLKESVENGSDALVDFFLKEKNTERCPDFIGICSQVLTSHAAKNRYELKDIISQDPGDIVIRLSERFREYGVGYQFESKETMRIDSQLIRADVVRLTLTLLSGEPLFEGANDELLAAHEHCRHKRYKECPNDCLESLESIMKAVHDKNNWKYNPNDTASKLINSCLSQNPAPAYLQSQFTDPETMLEIGILIIRSRNAGHGRGANIKEVPKELVSYMLHLTATDLLSLLKCEKNVK